MAKKINESKKEEESTKIMTSKKNKKKKKNKKSKKNKQKDNTKKTMFKGLNGTEYDEEGNPKENISDSEEGNEEFTSLFINDYLAHIKVSNKTTKAKKYLEDFKNKKWKFNKNMQIQLLKYILYDQIFEKEYFEIFQQYLINMFKTTKNSFIKKCEDNIEIIKKSNEDEGNLNFKIDSHELKFQNIENKKLFLLNLNKRCTDIIENN
jgi:hypothetical protein